MSDPTDDDGRRSDDVPRPDTEPSGTAGETGDPGASETGDPGADEATTGPVDIAGLATEGLSTQPVSPAGGVSSPGQPAPDRPSTRPVTAQQPIGTGADTGDFAPMPASPPTGETPVVRRSSPKGRRPWRTAALITAAVLLLVVIAGAGTELYLRNRVTNCMESAFGNLTGTSTTVSVPRGPMIFAWLGGDLDWVQVDTNDSANGSAMRLHARADEVASDGRTAKSLRGSAFVPFERVKELADQQPGGEAQIESVTGSGADGTLTVEANYPVTFLSVPATVAVKPTLTGGKVTFQVTEAKAFGIGLPNDFAQGIVDQIAEAMLGPLFNEIAVDDLKVTDQGIEFTFAGDDVNLQAASQGSGTEVKCGA